MKTRMWHLQWGILLLCLPFFVAGCRSTGTKDDDWQSIAEVRASPGEKKLWERAMMALGNGNKKAEAGIWRTHLRSYPRGYFAGLAHMRLGLHAYRAKQWQRAESHFQATKKHTLSTQERNYILMYHARTLQHQKKYVALEALLKPRYKELPIRNQRKAITLLIEASTAQKKHRQAFDWRMQLLTMAQSGSRDTIQKRIIQTVQAMKKKELLAFLRHAHQQRMVFPLDYMALRLAKLYYAKDKYKPAKQWLGKLTKQLGIGHPLYQSSRALLAEIKEVRRPADHLTIGVILPQSGPAVLIGQHVRRGVDLGISEFPYVKLIFRDSAGLPSQAAAAVDELVRQHKAIAIFGPPMPGTAIAAAKRAQTLGVPYISITAREGFPKLGSFIFRNNFTLSEMGRSVARYGFNNLRIKRFGVLYPASGYGRIQAQAFINEINRLGAKMTGAMEYDPNTKDYQFYVRMLLGTSYANGHLLKLSRKHMRGMQAYQKRRLRKKVAKMLKPMVPFEGLFIPEQAKLASQLAAYLAYYNVGLKRPNLGQSPMFFSPLSFFRRIQLLGNNNWYHKDLFSSGNKYVRGGMFCTRFYQGSYRTASQQFVQMYQRTYNKAPIHINAFAYDAIRLLGSIASSGRARTRPKFRRALLKIKNFEGPTGPINARADGEMLGPVHFVMAYKGQFQLHGTLK